jgi:beta-galactosidase
MEQQSGPGGQMSYLLRTPEPGEIRLWTYQSIAHGADRLLYFTWRTCPFGTEQHWHGLVDQDGKDNRRLREASQTAAEIATLPDEFFDAKPAKVAAVLRDFDIDVNEKRINTYPHDGRWAHGRWAAALLKRHVPVDFVWSDDDFDGYAVLFAGHLKIVDDEVVAKLKRFVERGGTLVLGAQSGLHDRNLHIVQQTPPGPLAELAGVEVEDWTTLEKGREAYVMGKIPSFCAIAFAERLRLITADVVAHWLDRGSLLGRAPAVARNVVGKGQVIYIGAYTDLASTERIVEWLLELLKVESLITPTRSSDEEPLEVVVRTSPQHTFVCLLNHGSKPLRVPELPEGYVPLVADKSRSKLLSIPPYGVAIVRYTVKSKSNLIWPLMKGPKSRSRPPTRKRRRA